MASDICLNTAGPLVPAADYQRLGSMHQTANNGLEVYVTGPRPNAKGFLGGIILLYDLFGFEEPQIFQVADKIASEGFLVACPDVFCGAKPPLKVSEFPPSEEMRSKLVAFMGQRCNYDAAKVPIAVGVELMRSLGVTTKLGLFGFCWSVAPTLSAGKDHETFFGVGGAHPGPKIEDPDTLSALAVPVILLPANGDPMEKVEEAVKDKPFAGSCRFKRYNDMQHGFVGARGNWADERVAASAKDAIDQIVRFSKALI